MGIKPVLLAPAFAGLLLVTGCSDGEATTLSVTGTVSICPDNGSCVDLPAAGAAVTVFDETGDTVDQGTLDSHGVWMSEVPEGSYTAALSLDPLDIATTQVSSPSVSLSDGESGELAITLPPVRVAG